MDLEKLEEILKDEPKFRLQQAKQAIFKNLIGNWQEAISLPQALREKLNQECPLEIKAEVLSAQDRQSQKAVVTLADGFLIETVLMRHKDGRATVCVSSQVGCPVGCLFCLTGKLGFKRNLTSMEIVEQVLLWARMLNKDGDRVSNIVFMGMGEPLLNYENVMEAVKILNSKSGLNIGIRHISISTVGITEGIKKLAAETIRPNLALSLHATNDQLRNKMIPLAENYSLADLTRALDYYIKKTKQRVMFEYLMLKDYNDSEGQAGELARFVAQFQRPSGFPKGRNFYFVNLIAYNPTAEQQSYGFSASLPERIQKFKAILKEAGIEVVQRYKFGRDIKGACGQLAGKNISNKL
ncbi:MAG: 23S rRNA (adenine(2503)-C(2))-methyltransferase RlmN [Candidatus Pacebacteria bacterium]|nr:23S rRNA (adenine(2503)-C(2))-methyltransferase RlmN [Candidatus Paceibacterota bacterium]